MRTLLLVRRFCGNQVGLLYRRTLDFRCLIRAAFFRDCLDPYGSSDFSRFVMTHLNSPWILVSILQEKLPFRTNKIVMARISGAEAARRAYASICMA